MSKAQPSQNGELSPSEHDVLAASGLSEALRAGSRPQPIASDIVVGPGEAVYAHAGVQILQHTGAQVSYSRGGFLAVGNPMVMAATLAGSALYNRHNRRKAVAQAAPQWRHLDEGIMYLTNARIALQGRTGWVDVSYPALRATHCDGEGLIVYVNAEPPFKLQTWCPGWYYALLRYLAYGEIVPVAVPDELRRRAVSAGMTRTALPAHARPV